jgi:hypothetical protein
MKLLNQFICVIVAGLFFASCNYLDVVPDNLPTLDNAFSDRYTAQTYLATCYWGMPKSAGWNENPAVFGALEMVFNKEWSITGGFQYGLGNDNATSPRINYWGGTSAMVRSLYAGINNCNTFLDRIGGVQDLNMYEKKRWIAEVTLIKAYMHFYLITYYGPICPLKENMPVNESIDGIRVYREKIDDCFDYVFELLDSVIVSNALPKIIDNTTTELGRFTQAAAYMLKAKVLMYWASPLFNGNTDYNSFLDHNGEPFFNQKYDPNRWQLAADACKQAIEICESSGIRLFNMNDYVTAKPMSDSTRIVNTLRSVVSLRWNCELVWGNSSYPVNSGLQNPCFPRLEQGTSASTTGTMSVPLHIVDKFYSKNGVPIEEDTSYPYAERFGIRTGDYEHRFYIQQGEQTAAMNFDREPRFYSTLGFDRGKWYGNSYKNEPEDDSQCLYPKDRFGEYSSVFQPGEYNATGYWPKKLVSINSTFRDANSVTYETFPFPDLRYADLLLFCAEALNEVKSSPDAEVYQYIDAVRKRAGLEGVVESWRKYSTNPSKPSTQAGMREIIQRERAVEFACEGQYYWDSHRWKTAVKEQNRPIQGWDVSKTGLQDYYTVTTLYTQRFTYRNYFAPIPESDIINNPLLVQNPGW